ncbi:MAG: uroporphyrinogen-III synthase, partial [Anaerolineae bacterium]|nr:uroporphyrinogen-III synthase [Anaerolineae bacterium]
VVGHVTALRETLRWFEKRPLFGERILVTRTRSQVSELSSRLRHLGAEVVELPTIRIEPLSDWEPFDKAIASLTDYDWIVFTSVNGISSFWARLKYAGYDARVLHGLKVAAVGPATTTAIEAIGLIPDYVPSQYVADTIAVGLGDIQGKHILVPRSDIARPALVEELLHNGAYVTEITAYHTVQPEINGSELNDVLSDITIATFTSSSTVRNLVRMSNKANLDLLQIMRDKTIACIGPVTADTAESLGLPVHVMAHKYTIDGLVEAVTQHITGKDVFEK